MTMMLQGTDFERLNRVDSRRARTAGSDSIAGPWFARQATSWLLSARASTLSSVAPGIWRRSNVFNRLVRRSESPRGGIEAFLSSINGGERKCARL
ncbi:hypothetical protein FXB40_07290 [Bradyrhizobium rifense]|uniref:Uncharacterized protein n=1 Tax=Bradyrhizobium rifense TaxID=515499 RepID=A0A5D3KJ71_9BRAD|nr:hypothetical protein [Bradyrhizobium rifense]TYL97709.1 hypothetical protein FXB40_07290 [Bradyrhizobium rifense]